MQNPAVKREFSATKFTQIFVRHHCHLQFHTQLPRKKHTTLKVKSNILKKACSLQKNKVLGHVFFLFSSEKQSTCTSFNQAPLGNNWSNQNPIQWKENSQKKISKWKRHHILSTDASTILHNCKTLLWVV